MKKKVNRTSIGGQAVIEGVMMRGRSCMATAVRDETGQIQTEALRVKPYKERPRWQRLVFVRGVINFVSSLVLGMKTLMRSAEVCVSEDSEEKSKLSKWMEEHLKVSVGGIITAVSLVVGVILALALFVFLPLLFTDMIATAAPVINEYHRLWYHLIEGGFRLVIFILYILFTLLSPSLREVYQYHGAEHKTINCYEYGMPLTPENVKKCSRLHDRCGTTFLFIVLIISILVFALVGVPLDMLYAYAGITGILQRLIAIVARLLLLPVVAGISYELLKLLSYTNFFLFFPFKAPGYLLQKLTTREPDEKKIECAIRAFQKVLEMDADPDMPEKLFATETKLSKLTERIKKNFRAQQIDESDAEWMLSISLGIPRSALSEERIISRADCKRVLDVFDERLTGRPLWYIYGDTSFYGYTFKVDERVLIPRPETEILVHHAVAALKEGDNVLDLCTGSGAVAVCIACEGAKDKHVTVVGTDISESALEVARENARINKANVSFVKSDLFENVRGRYNIITANPPYVRSAEIATLPRDVREFEPRLALDGGTDGLEFYRHIAEKAPRYLTRGGLVILECGEDQAQEVVKIFQSATRCDFTMVVKDDAGIDRIVKIGF